MHLSYLCFYILSFLKLHPWRVAAVWWLLDGRYSLFPSWVPSGLTLGCGGRVAAMANDDIFSLLIRQAVFYFSYLYLLISNVFILQQNFKIWRLFALSYSYIWNARLYLEINIQIWKINLKDVSYSNQHWKSGVSFLIRYVVSIQSHDHQSNTR